MLVGPGLKGAGGVNREQPPASTLVIVKQLLRPELLIELDAIAVTKD
jgi:enamine deaminase RidA (YjgF/YER057c/UK114 family)